MIQIGVFDSGIGGAGFARELHQAHPDFEITVIHDNKNVPYGSKTPEQIEKLTATAIQPLLGKDVIVIACNTATAYAIDYLRMMYPEQKFVGFEPALKIAEATTKSRSIAVLATPATLSSPRYQTLKAACEKSLIVHEPNVKDLAHQIETNAIDWTGLQATLDAVVKANVDTIVLGCTHYHLIEDEIQKLVGDAVKIITPTHAVIRQIEKQLIG